ncbi:hypothetical protein A2U01_0039097, partial [Trifolium medium]|nr:hypothetical protein [Trifolium medium]
DDLSWEKLKKSLIARYGGRSLYPPSPRAAVILYGPSQFWASFPSLAFLSPISARRSTKSPCSYSLGTTILLYLWTDVFLTTDSAIVAKLLVSSMMSCSSRRAWELSRSCRG